MEWRVKSFDWANRLVVACQESTVGVQYFCKGPPIPGARWALITSPNVAVASEVLEYQMFSSDAQAHRFL